MLNPRNLTVISVLTASFIYILTRYHKKKKALLDQLIESKKTAEVLYIGTEFIEATQGCVFPVEAHADISLYEGPKSENCTTIPVSNSFKNVTEVVVCSSQDIDVVIPSRSTMLNSATEKTVKGIANLSVVDESNSREECNMSGSDMSEEATPTSSQSDSAEDNKHYDFPKGVFDDPDNDIVEDSPEVLGDRTIPRVLVPSDLWAEAVETDVWRETYFVPASMGGVLIGRFGKNVRELKSQWNAEFSLNMCPGRQDTLLLKLSCPLEHKENVIHWINSRFKMRPSQTTIGNPNQLRRLLPLGDVTPVKVRSLYGLKELFVTVKDKEFDRYVAMQEELDKDYATLNSSRMQLYEPVTSGTVAVSPHNFGYARALILKVLLTWPRQAVCFLLDHGTFGVLGLSDLRKIKAKYMRVPFQAIHVSWAHALPIYCDVPDLHILRTFFSTNNTHVYPVRMETCCRSSVTFLDKVEDKKPVTYADMLALACRSGLYMVSPLGLFSNRQTWLNRSNKAYYACPYSEIDYNQLVEFYPEEPCSSQPLQPLGTSQSQNVQGNENKSFSNRGVSNVGGRGRGFRRFPGNNRRFRGPPNGNQTYSKQPNDRNVTNCAGDTKAIPQKEIEKSAPKPIAPVASGGGVRRNTSGPKRNNQPSPKTPGDTLAKVPESAPSSKAETSTAQQSKT